MNLRFDQIVTENCFESLVFQDFKSMTEEFHIHIIGSNEGPDRKNSLSLSPYGSAHDIQIY